MGWVQRKRCFIVALICIFTWFPLYDRNVLLRDFASSLNNGEPLPPDLFHPSTPRYGQEEVMWPTFHTQPPLPELWTLSWKFWTSQSSPVLLRLCLEVLQRCCRNDHMLTFSLLFLYFLYFMPRCQLFFNVEICLWCFNYTYIFMYCLCIDYAIDWRR